MGFWDTTTPKRPEEQSGGFWGVSVKPKVSILQQAATKASEESKKANSFWGLAKETVRGIPKVLADTGRAIGTAARDTAINSSPARGQSLPSFAKETVKAIPQSFSTQVGQPSLRAAAGVASAVTKKPFTPTGQFQQDLYGTDKPITLSSVGRETRMADPQGESKGFWKAADPALGLFMGLADATPAGKPIRSAMKGVAAAADATKGVLPAAKEANVFKGFDDISTKLLGDLTGRSTVSKQYLSDATNRPDLKQPERDLFRRMLDDEGDTVDVPTFANKVKSELLPLTTKEPKNISEYRGQSGRYESINLPDELRGPVANYKERVYESPIKTSAGEVHFSGARGSTPENYFAHTRIEDLPNEGVPAGSSSGLDYLRKKGYGAELASKGGTRRVIEIQSDLFQKGRLENEGGTLNKGEEVALRGERTLNIDGVERSNFYEHSLEQANQKLARQKELAPLEPYRNTWHERVIREEVKQAAKDGKTKLQFPTGETAMKIEGLGTGGARWEYLQNPGDSRYTSLTPDDLKVGREVSDTDNDWIITDVLGDGKFKAVPRDTIMSMEEDLAPLGYGSPDDVDFADKRVQELLEQQYAGTEQFDISGKVDTENPIYRFYEKTVQKYLNNKYGGKVVTDPQGVKWVEIPVDPKRANAPVEAYGIGAGIQPETDEDGKVTGVKFDPAMASAGLLGIAALNRSKGALARTTSSGFDSAKYVREQVAAREGARIAGNPTVVGKAKTFLANAKTKLVDFSAPIEDVLYATTKKAGIKLKPSEDIHNQIDRVLRAPTIAGQFVRDNGLDQIIKKVDDVDALDQYLIARHAQELDTRGITTGRDLVKDKALIEALGPKYQKEAQTVVDYSRKLLDYSVDSGLINKELAAELKRRYPDYVPFSRVFTEIEKQGGVNGKAVASLSRQTVVQKIVGSEREIESPLRSLMEKTNDAFKQGEKNKAAKLLAGYEKLPGNPFQLKEIDGFVDDATGKILHTADDNAHDTISFLDDGVKRTFKTTPEVAQAAKALNVQQLNILGKIFALPTRIARVGLTGINIPFVATNVARDQITAFINTDKAMATSLANPKNFLRALWSATKHDDLYKEMVRAGGGGTTYDMSRNQVESTFESIRAGKNLGSRILHTVKNPGDLLRAVEDIVGRAEELTRIQQYRGTKTALLKEGMDASEAVIGGARAARDTTVNFARRGEWGTVLNSALLYINAGIQGTRTFMRNMKTKPVATSAKIVTSTLFPVAVITAWNLNDPKRKAAYEDIPEWEKENNLIIIPDNPTQDSDGKWNVIKIPLSQEINDLTRLTRRPIEVAYGFDPIAFGDFYKTIVGTISPIGPEPRAALSSVIPQAIKPTIESTVNQNLFTGTPIVPMGLDKQAPEDQVKSYTSGTARKIAGFWGGSPLKTEAFIKGTFGGVGMQALNASDQALYAAGAIPKEQIGGQSIPEGITARFNKAAGGEQESKAYDILGKAAQEKAVYKANNIRPIYDQAQALKAEGKIEEANALWAALSEKDKEIYKGIKSSEKAKATVELERKLVPLYDKLQAMKTEGRVEEANAIYYALSPEEQHAYTLLKKKLQ